MTLTDNSKQFKDTHDVLYDGMQASDWRLNSEEKVWNGFFEMWRFCLDHRRFDKAWFKDVKRELFHRGAASSAIVYDPQMDCVGLVEQFRIGAIDSHLGPWTLEGVAGLIEAGESAEALIRRELKEEAGIQHCELIPITSYYPSPGGSNEKIHLFCAISDLSGREGLYGNTNEHEDIRFHVLPLDDVLRALYDSRLNNAATIIGLQWLEAQRSKLRSYAGGSEEL